jgi:hypothetical protein
MALYALLVANLVAVAWVDHRQTVWLPAESNRPKGRVGIRSIILLILYVSAVQI